MVSDVQIFHNFQPDYLSFRSIEGARAKTGIVAIVSRDLYVELYRYQRFD